MLGLDNLEKLIRSRTERQRPARQFERGNIPALKKELKHQLASLLEASRRVAFVADKAQDQR